MQKEITVALYDYRLINRDWTTETSAEAIEGLVFGLRETLENLGIKLACLREPEVVLEVGGYRDLLNTVRLRSPADHIGNLCLGHIIGQSSNCDLIEDTRRGIYRVAFAPEMIEPEGSDKVVCHNCGCGC